MVLLISNVISSLAKHSKMVIMPDIPAFFLGKAHAGGLMCFGTGVRFEGEEVTLTT